MTVSVISDIVNSKMASMISDLQTLIKVPSVSAKNQSLVECASIVSSMMQKAGISSQVLYLDKNGNAPEHDHEEKSSDSRTRDLAGVPPVVFGELRSKSNPNKTILFYNHYDVQPEEPVELWDGDPFSGRVEGNQIFGRGSSDDKGELVTRIKAVEYFLEKTGDVPCNVKFFVEGEEEIGSVHVEDYLVRYKDKLRCNAVIWEFGYVDSRGRPIISLGMKGLLYVELNAKGPIRDAHSSLAVIIENPAWRLVSALHTLRDQETGRILIRDWYKEVKSFTKQELAVLAREPFDERDFKNEYGIRKFVNNAKGVNVKRALAGTPTCNIAGLNSGYNGEGAKTVLPSSAKVKIDFRLVPEMQPELQLTRLRKHLKSKGFGDIEVVLIHGEAAARTPLNDPFVQKVEQAALEAFGSAIVSVSSAGTGPMHSFVKVLSVPCVSVGSTYMFARIHSPNEFARIDLLNKATKCIGGIIERFAKNT